ncbi:hypothetical protein SLEP1_g46066 [Rubroshorea leprosula]|uniref:NYN domain-containing protein n=1 Tax=Rubroshorea leprosula TaxID=152421 RepID=A0AAV5LL14_9ROSI|nr:hypothetical protein SLEP1_g46066 [Rubroshorea leprosula]
MSVNIRRVGYGLADELKRAGFWVKTVSNKPQAADVALRDHMVDVMDKRRAECVVLVSDDSDFVDVLNEAKLRCVKTVVVGDVNDGALKRVADAAFCWREILMGKAKKEAVSVVGNESNDESENEFIDGIIDGGDAGSIQKEDTGAWWDLDTDSDVFTSQLSE